MKKIEDENTPTQSSGSGKYLRDQSRQAFRQRLETMHTCPMPGCEGGEIRTQLETGTWYRVQIETCQLCEGRGVVTKTKAAEWAAVFT